MNSSGRSGSPGQPKSRLIKKDYPWLSLLQRSLWKTEETIMLPQRWGLPDNNAVYLDTYASVCYCCVIILLQRVFILNNIQRQFSIVRSRWGENTPAKWPRVWGKCIVLPQRVQGSLSVQGGLGLKPLIPALIHNSLLGFQMCVLIIPHVCSPLMK